MAFLVMIFLISGSILVAVNNNFFFKYFKVSEPLPLVKPIISNTWSKEFGGGFKYLFWSFDALSRLEAISGIPFDSELPALLFNFFSELET